MKAHKSHILFYYFHFFIFLCNQFLPCKLSLCILSKDDCLQIDKWILLFCEAFKSNLPDNKPKSASWERYLIHFLHCSEMTQSSRGRISGLVLKLECLQLSNTALCISAGFQKGRVWLDQFSRVSGPSSPCFALCLLSILYLGKPQSTCLFSVVFSLWHSLTGIVYVFCLSTKE